MAAKIFLEREATMVLKDSTPKIEISKKIVAKAAAGRSKIRIRHDANFSEAVTGLLDLDRLKRISLRVIAIDMAIEGADLYQLFDFFREKGQSEKESFNSAARIFWGGHPQGGIVFTKDGVYLEGLIEHPKFLPDWYQNVTLLAGKMAFSLILNDISLKTVEEHFEKKFPI